MFKQLRGGSFECAVRQLARPTRGWGTRFLSSGRPRLAHEVIVADALADDASQCTKTAVVMHGVLGHHKNMRQISTKLANTFPHYRFLLVTHRGHGMSETGQAPFSVHACAQDVLALLQDKELTPDVVIGHSFGGKVALAMLETSIEKPEFSDLRATSTCVLDCPPGAWTFASSPFSSVASQAQDVIDTVRSLPGTFKSKTEVANTFVDHGFDEALAQWMTLNLKKHNGDYRFMFSVDVLHKLLQDHKKLDFWQFLNSKELAQAHANIQFIRAERNPAWCPLVLGRFGQISNPRITELELEGVGHWLHAEKPSELVALMHPNFL